METTRLCSFSELLADPQAQELPPNSRPSAALLASKVYFYVGALEEAVDFALQAGAAFEREPEGEYRQTIIGELLTALLQSRSMKWYLQNMKIHRLSGELADTSQLAA